MKFEKALKLDSREGRKIIKEVIQEVTKESVISCFIYI